MYMYEKRLLEVSEGRKAVLATPYETAAVAAAGVLTHLAPPLVCDVT
jgi:hypothetical protein